MNLFLIENLGTIVTGLLIAGIVVLIILKMIRDKRKGKMISCDCGCDGCAKARTCNISKS